MYFSQKGAVRRVRSCLSLLKKGDFAIMGIVLCSVLMSFAALNSRQDDKQLEIIVTINGEEVYRQPWSREQTYTIGLNLPKGAKAFLDVTPEGVQMQPLPFEVCPAQICSHMGRISKPGQVILCVPNKLIVEIARVGSLQLDIDGITE